MIRSREGFINYNIKKSRQKIFCHSPITFDLFSIIVLILRNKKIKVHKIIYFKHDEKERKKERKKAYLLL